MPNCRPKTTSTLISHPKPSVKKPRRVGNHNQSTEDGEQQDKHKMTPRTLTRREMYMKRYQFNKNLQKFERDDDDYDSNNNNNNKNKNNNEKKTKQCLLESDYTTFGGNKSKVSNVAKGNLKSNLKTMAHSPQRSVLDDLERSFCNLIPSSSTRARHSRIRHAEKYKEHREKLSNSTANKEMSTTNNNTKKNEQNNNKNNNNNIQKSVVQKQWREELYANLMIPSDPANDETQQKISHDTRCRTRTIPLPRSESCGIILSNTTDQRKSDTEKKTIPQIKLSEEIV